MALRAVALLGLPAPLLLLSPPQPPKQRPQQVPLLRQVTPGPGGGWDNLRNVNMGRVMNFTFSLCHTTEDGLYLVPDEVFVIPQKVTRVETNSEIISSWLDQTLLHFCRPHPVGSPDSSLNKCRSAAKSLSALEVLPGGGWDNLRNMDMGWVMNLSFSLCLTTVDGLYLVPDKVFVIPQKVTGVETNSEIISSWLDQKSATSSSINADISFFSVLNAKFSTENQRMKTHQVRDTSVTTRVQVRNFLYTVKANPDFTLDSSFARQAEEIADAIENNQTQHASYLSERMVLDFGTHVITSVDAGASLVQEDYLRSSYVSDGKTDKSSITASAGINFFNKVNFNISSKDAHETSETKGYQDNVTYSIVQSHGGVPFYPGITLQKWQESTSNNLVAIDLSGLPLHHFINHNTFPDLPCPTVDKLALSVSHAIRRYYAINTHPGCVKANSKNFNFQANVDDGSCVGPATNISFGGVFQQCTKLTPDADPICQAWDQKNPDTGNYSCRPPYQPTLLRSEVREERYSQYVCHSCGFLGLKQCCGDEYHVRSARIQTYSCSSTEKISDNSGYLFGGLYGPSLQNPLTKSSSCPPNFIPLKMLSGGLMICVSNDYETGSRFSVPFGGLFSCKSTNPLAGGQPRCPPQFSQHLATVSDGCQILYCVQSGLFTGGQLLPVRLPPFTRPPLVSMSANNTVAVMTEGGRVWVRDAQTTMWKMVKPEEVQKMVRMFNPESDQLSGGQKFGVAFGVIVLVVLVVVVVVLVRRRWRGLPGLMRARGHEEFFNEVQSTRAEDSAGEQTSTNQV
ncbi:macrophage-expressed gene 1 protein-like [Hypomesus transpacificus]|uniref:macrophage-expressed gene 1 protein-like n=1 Tax=Hypomesus transpacificus TaxID=137520 RepID=UPI001F07AA3E|nr:macrophage-expressed gene 1 protein-like [Hypomesus transpacificus]